MGASAARASPLMMAPLLNVTVTAAAAAFFLVATAALIALATAESPPNLFIDNQSEGRQQFQKLYDCPQCNGNPADAQVEFSYLPRQDKDVNIIVTYSDPSSGAIRTRTVKSKDLSASWVWKDPEDVHRDRTLSLQVPGNLFKQEVRLSESDELSIVPSNPLVSPPMHPAKLQRRMLRKERREQRAAELIHQNKEVENLMQEAAIEQARELDTTTKGRYSIWRKEYENPNSDSTVKLMHDQIIMARAYATIAKARNETFLYDALVKRARENQLVIGEATSDAELQPSALESAKQMGHILATAKDKFYDCIAIARKLRAMLQSTEESLSAQKKKSAFLIQLAAKTVPKPLHCIPLLLTTDYFFHNYEGKEFPNKEKLEDPSLYHYAIFSDNVVATSVVVRSTVVHAKEPEKHVFHIVTDKLNFAAMRMWFLVNPPAGATVQVENVDDFTWLNSSYCPVLRQLESSRMIEYYFKAHQASSLTAGADNLKYRNPKYLSMLNHLRFYLPEVYPKLDKILFLDDDIVVQKDLTPLWSVDLLGRVNGAVETCKESFHRFDKYLNFSNPMISENFDPNACGWAYGMNIFDLKEWKKRNITGIYHYWQDRV
ncbi:OLC1v1036536C2 [Oldenlandia corymbosa var. corymbosa]|uniref:Hexosyltransferase n=1 Tax=Oldenlandia corymbosa var. corymbosa TaxID=529605 RepID=A0AAV1CVJ1_OLDCO|nr:OLC1v1036536C2 [Oldenlandia corymbosa var. corymbosa]